jgi:hypothetical protein
MTAEIAILNKSAVALATDSAVTISAGTDHQKIFDSADKLFDLCKSTPVGLMIYNNMQFTGIPLSILISEYRKKNTVLDTIEMISNDFLNFLNETGMNAQNTGSDSVKETLEYVYAMIFERINRKMEEHFSASNVVARNLDEVYSEIKDNAISAIFFGLSRCQNSLFSGDSDNLLSDENKESIKSICQERWGSNDLTKYPKLVDLSNLAIVKDFVTGRQTGLVFAGYGSEEIFPTLVSFEIDGVFFGLVKYRKTNNVDIDRNGERSRVLPFAQKEMVERFLYGLDADIERKIVLFCKNTVPEIGNQLLNNLDATDDVLKSLSNSLISAQDAFVNNLASEGLEGIRTESKSAIEDMVEFMPKPEMASMAEALVNLTSIKRRVTRGVETVGGPIDVAIISKTDGFIWVKRKHYFSADLNPRYMNRVKNENA